MVYTLCKYPDETEVVFSDIRMQIATCDEEVEEFKQIVERGANLFFKYAREGGLKLA